MKQMKYPSQLRTLEVQLEALDAVFVQGIILNARNLKELSVKFARLDIEPIP